MEYLVLIYIRFSLLQKAFRRYISIEVKRGSTVKNFFRNKNTYLKTQILSAVFSFCCTTMCPFRIFIVGCRTSQLAIYCQEPHAWSYNRTWHYIEWVCFTIMFLLLQRRRMMMMMVFGVKPKENCSLFLILVGYLASMLSPMFDVGQCSLCLSGKLVCWLYVECRFVFSLFS